MSTAYDKFLELVGNDPDLEYLKNIISFGRMEMRRYIANISSDLLYQMRTAGSVSEYYGFRESTSWIRVISMTNKFFENFRFIWTNDSSILVDSDYGHSIRIRDRSTLDYAVLFEKTINVHSDINTSGTSIHLLNLIKTAYKTHLEQESTWYNHLLNRTFKILTISQKNFIIGLIDNHGILWLNHNLMDKIYSTCSIDEFNSVMKNILGIFAAFHLSFTERKIDHFKYELKNDVLEQLFDKNFKNSLNYELGIRQDLFDLFKPLGVTKENISDSITEIVSNCFRDLMDSSRDAYWGADAKYSYRRMLDTYISKRICVNNELIRNSFDQGLRTGRQFENLGWSLSTCREIPYYTDSDSSIVWKKEINIKPKFYVAKSKMHAIKEEWLHEGPHYINTLWLTSDGVMYASGCHPNVSRGKVCMGDIRGKINIFNADYDTLKELLIKVETLLLTINFDSAYTSEKFEWYRAHSEVCNIIDESEDISNGYVPQGENVFTEVEWVDEDDLEDLEDDLEDSSDEPEDSSDEPEDPPEEEITTITMLSPSEGIESHPAREYITDREYPTLRVDNSWVNGISPSYILDENLDHN